MIWFYFALIYDGLILLILFSFSDYPLEKITLLLSALNPIDLGRISIMLKMDVSALMGYTAPYTKISLVVVRVFFLQLVSCCYGSFFHFGGH
jgi:hypothetical protein